MVRDRLALCFVGIENLGRGPAVEDAGELPGEVGRVRDAGTHAEAPERHPDVRGVAADEHAAIAKLARDEPAGGPILARQELVLEVRPDSENRPDHPVAIKVIQPGFSRIGVILYVPGLQPIDSHRHAAAARIEREVEPGRLAGQQAPELRCPDVERLRVLEHRVADELGADRLAHKRARPVASDEVVAFDR